MKIPNKFILSLLFIFCGLGIANAYDFEVDGIYYNIISMSELTCEVVGCDENITNLTLNQSVEFQSRNLKIVNIKQGAFSNMDNLLSVAIHNIEILNNDIFKNCRNLEKLTLENVCDIRGSCFMNCNLTSLIIPSSVQFIGSYAFSNNKLYDIFIEDSDTILESKGSNVFLGNEPQQLYLGRDIKNFGDTWGDSLKNIEIGDNVTIFPSYLGKNVPEINMKNSKIKEIDSQSFYKNINLNNIVLPSQLISIGSEAFYGCNNLTEIIFPTSLELVGESAFAECKNLTGDLNLFFNVSKKSFKNCHFNNVVINGNLSVIEEESFVNSIYGSLKIEDGIKLIKNSAFADNKFLKVTLPENTISSIGNEVFKNCINLTTFIVPSSVDTIGYSVFEGCLKLENLTLVPTETPLYFDSKIETTFSSAVESFGTYSNYHMSPFVIENLKNIFLGRNLIPLYKKEFDNQTVPPFDVYHTQTVNHYNFYSLNVTNSTLEKLIIASNIEDPSYIIDSYSTSYNQYFGLSFSNIEWGHFWYNTERINNVYYEFSPTINPSQCETLKEIFCLNEEPPTLNVDFPTSVYLNAILYVPIGTKSIYASSKIWKNFWNIQERDYIPLDSIEFETKEISIFTEETLKLNLLITPKNAIYSNISWSSSNEDVVSVSEDGLITAVSPGSATITATIENLSATCIVTVTDPIIDPEQVILNYESVEIILGESFQLEATVLPEDTTDKSLSWNSSDPNIATVSDNGLVKAISAGTSIITATCGDISAECAITVLEDAGVESLLANPESKITIYTTDGILIKKDCKVDDLKILNKGIYIIVSGKEHYKISI